MANKSTTTLLKDWAQIIALIGGVILSFYIFVYEQIIVPANKPPAIVIEGGIQKGENLGTLKPIDVTIKVKNIGEGTTRILAAWYNVTASTTSEKESSLASYKKELQANLNSTNRVDRFRKQYHATPVSSGKIYENDWYLEKDEEVVEQFVVFIPKRFNLIQLKVEVNYSKGKTNDEIEWIVDEDASIRSEILTTDDGEDNEFVYTKAIFEKVI